MSSASVKIARFFQAIPTGEEIYQPDADVHLLFTVCRQASRPTKAPTIMFASLGVGIELYRCVRFADRILEGLFPVFPHEEVIGQESPVLVNPLGKNGFHRFPRLF